MQLRFSSWHLFSSELALCAKRMQADSEWMYALAHCVVEPFVLDGRWKWSSLQRNLVPSWPQQCPGAPLLLVADVNVRYMRALFPRTNQYAAQSIIEVFRSVLSYTCGRGVRKLNRVTVCALLHVFPAMQLLQTLSTLESSLSTRLPSKSPQTLSNLYFESKQNS